MMICSAMIRPRQPDVSVKVIEVDAAAQAIGIEKLVGSPSGGGMA